MNARGKRSCLLEEFIGERGRKFSSRSGRASANCSRIDYGAAGRFTMFGEHVIVANRVWVAHVRRWRVGGWSSWTGVAMSTSGLPARVSKRGRRDRLGEEILQEVPRRVLPPPLPRSTCVGRTTISIVAYIDIYPTADTRLMFYLFDAYPIMFNYNFWPTIAYYAHEYSSDLFNLILAYKSRLLIISLIKKNDKSVLWYNNS